MSKDFLSNEFVKVKGMITDGFIQGSLDNISFEILSESFDKKAKLNEIKNDAIEFISGEGAAKNKENSRFIPIKLTKEEVQKAHECQKVMLNFVFRQYQNSMGTEKEAAMQKLYNDALIDYDDFVAQHKDQI